MTNLQNSGEHRSRRYPIDRWNSQNRPPNHERRVTQIKAIYIAVITVDSYVNPRDQSSRFTLKDHLDNIMRDHITFLNYSHVVTVW